MDVDESERLVAERLSLVVLESVLEVRLLKLVVVVKLLRLVELLDTGFNSRVEEKIEPPPPIDSMIITTRTIIRGTALLAVFAQTMRIYFECYNGCIF